MNREEFKHLYDDIYPLYDRLLTNIHCVVEGQLNSAGIPYLNLEKRVKTLDSSFEKVARKHYDDPFKQIEDFCGLRIICYYPSDVDKIVSLLRQEFEVASEEDTQTRLKANEFGYRSTHLVLSIPKDWLKAPQYRGLDGLKAEVQMRTILMHAWAEIQHKLAYKSADQVPDAFQRKLFRLSAKFEEADEQLEHIRDGLFSYRSEIRPAAGLGFASLRGQPLNLDTLTILLDAAYPMREKSDVYNSELLDELSKVSLTMDDLIDAITAHAPFSNQLEKEEDDGDKTFRWMQVGALRSALDMANDAYYSSRLANLSDLPEWREPAEFSRRLFGRPTT